MSKPTLQLGGGNWAAKNDGTDNRNLLGFAVGDTSGKYIPRDLKFTRTADIAATRVNKDGLVEKFRENVLLNSGDFSIAGASGGWVKNNSTVTSGYTGYDGTTNAWKLESTVLTSFNNLNQNETHNAAITPLGSKVATFSVYLKAGTTNWVRLNLNGTGNVYFDLENGAVGTASGGDVLGQIESAGNGFYRCSITRLSGGAFDICYVYLAESDGSILPNTHSTPEHIFVQHPQLEYGLVATDYIETDSSTASAGVLNNLPRIDYTSGGAQLLVEPSRTNICLNSEGVDSLEGSGATATLDQDVVSPTGYKGGVVELTNLLGAANDRKQFVADIASGNRGQSFCASAYVKGTSGETMSYQFKRTTGTYVGAPKVRHTFSGEWERLDQTFTTLADTEEVGFHFTNDSDTADSIYIWGMQIEKGENNVDAYPTSYIPTYGAQDTRTFETCETIDDLNIGNSYTILFDFDQTHNPVVNTVTFQTEDSSDADAIEGRWYGDVDGFRIYDQLNNAYPISTIYSSSTKKWVARIDGTTSFDLFHNDSGTPTKRSGTALSAAVDLKTFKIKGNGPRVNNIKIFDSALSDSECNALVE